MNGTCIGIAILFSLLSGDEQPQSDAPAAGPKDAQGAASSSADCGEWSSVAPMNVQRGEHGLVTPQDGRVLAVGGHASSDSRTHSTSEMLEVVRVFDQDLELKYNKFYIGLAKAGQPNNFVIFRPKKDWLRLEVRLDRSDETQSQLDESGLDVMEYDSRWGRYRMRVSKGDAAKHREFLRTLLAKAYKAAE